MPAPTQGIGQTSSLRYHLSSPDEKARAEFIKQIAKAFGEDQNLTTVASRFGCKRRTLERAMVDFPQLGAAIEEIRTGLNATKGSGP